MRLHFLLSAIVLCVACHHDSSTQNSTTNSADTSSKQKVQITTDISGVKKGWTMEKVEKKIGAPEFKQALGSSTDEKGRTVELENWYYNQGTQQISFGNGVVSGVSLDVNAASDYVNAKMDSARKAENNYGGVIQQGK